MLLAYGFAGMMLLQLGIALAMGNNQKRQQAANPSSAGGLPGGRSPGSISAIYAGVDNANALEAR